ncbi:MAG: 2-oxoglutarate ferredoxin oxidoreductase, gamma subunit [Bacteroidetes bacterium]|nr:2-oxoglutarate ferredoxin oxidoreductase, gamma subunit [Bacteroidota bacterium]
MNQPSLEKFESKVKPGGTLIFDSNGFRKFPTRTDINVYRIDATEYAFANNASKTLNMIILGGLLKIRPIVKVENVLKGLKKSLPERHHHLLPQNEEAIKVGMDLIQKYN